MGAQPTGRRRSGTGPIGLLAVVALAVGSPSSLPAQEGEREATAIVVAGGDVILGRPTADGVREIGGSDPLVAVGAILLEVDLAMVNLESPLCEVGEGDGSRSDSSVSLRAPPETVDRLAGVGIDAVGLANNHILDCGDAGVETTLTALDRAGIRGVGATDGADPLDPVIVEVQRHRVALFAVNLVRSRQVLGRDAAARVAWLDFEEVERQLLPGIRRLRERNGADLVLVSVHWGRELVAGPDPEQVSLAHALVDAGADAVIGHHPHVAQPVEAYGGGLIAYSLGNLLFDMPEPETLVGALAELRFAFDRDARGRVDGLVLHIVVADRADRRPRPAEAEEVSEVVDALARRSRERFGTELRVEEGRLVWP